MTDQLRPIGAWLYARAENLLAAMLAIMFVVFIIQIVFRYLLNFPIGWTHEISVVMWLWMVLFGTAFVVRDSEEIRFDIFYAAASGWTKRVMILISSLSLVVLFAISLPAVLDYIGFMKVERTAYLKIPFNVLYSIYGIFAIAMIVRQLYVAYQAVWGKGADEFDHSKASSGI